MRAFDGRDFEALLEDIIFPFFTNTNIKNFYYEEKRLSCSYTSTAAAVVAAREPSLIAILIIEIYATVNPLREFKTQQNPFESFLMNFFFSIVTFIF